MSFHLSSPPPKSIGGSIEFPVTAAYIGAGLAGFAAAILVCRLVTTPAALTTWYAAQILLVLSLGLCALSVIPPGRIMMRRTGMTIGVIAMILQIFGPR